MSDGELLISIQCWVIMFLLAQSRRVEIVAGAGFAVASVAFIVRAL